MKRILVVGQTPPPHGGQALMIERLLAGSFKNAELHHVRMSFAKDMNDMGRLRLGKLVHAAAVVLGAAYQRVRHNTDVLYYAPSGPDYLPMLRDMVVLSSIRWMFKSSIFHFHAAGTSEIYARLPRYLRLLYRWSYFKPDIAIQLSEFNPDDASVLEARTKFVIPNGIEDVYGAMGCPAKVRSDRCGILWVGLISESKGFLVLVEAMKLLEATGVAAHVTVVGSFVSDEFKLRAKALISSSGLDDVFEFTGVLTGQAKHEQFLKADIFCFPTFFESESFGLVVLEAMQFCLPVVATNWRGVQSLVKDEVTGYMVAPKDSQRLADKLGILVRDRDLRIAMGERGRQRFLQDYLVETFYERMDECFATA